MCAHHKHASAYRGYRGGFNCFWCWPLLLILFFLVHGWHDGGFWFWLVPLLLLLLFKQGALFAIRGRDGREREALPKDVPPGLDQPYKPYRLSEQSDRPVQRSHVQTETYQEGGRHYHYPSPSNEL